LRNKKKKLEKRVCKGDLVELTFSTIPFIITGHRERGSFFNMVELPHPLTPEVDHNPKDPAGLHVDVFLVSSS
jgi:hypothetical protein